MRTDNCIKTYLQSKCSPKSPKLLNWALVLSEIDYKVQHVRSKNSGISDCLSHIHNIYVLFELKPELSLNDLKPAQSHDPHLHPAINYLAANRPHFDVKLLCPLAGNAKNFTSPLMVFYSEKSVLSSNRSFVVSEFIMS